MRLLEVSVLGLPDGVAPPVKSVPAKGKVVTTAMWIGCQSSTLRNEVVRRVFLPPLRLALPSLLSWLRFLLLLQWECWYLLHSQRLKKLDELESVLFLFPLLLFRLRSLNAAKTRS